MSRKLLADKVSLGTDASVAAGPVGRHAAAATDAQLHAEMLSYSHTEGLFAGIDLSGGVLHPDKDADARAYGPNVTASDVVNRNETGRGLTRSASVHSGAAPGRRPHHRSQAVATAGRPAGDKIKAEPLNSSTQTGGVAPPVCMLGGIGLSTRLVRGRVSQWRDAHQVGFGVERELEPTDTAPIHALRHRSIAVMVNRGIACRALPARHGVMALGQGF